MEPTKLPTNNPSELKISFYKKLSRKKWFKIARPFIITALIILIIYILTIVGVFKIKKIETDKELKHIQNLTQITNQYLGEGYFSLNLEQMENDIKNSNRYIKTVSAAKFFPSKIRLEIEEYQPTSYLEYKDICYIFSQEGVILEEETEYEECVLENGILLESDQNILAENKLIFDTEVEETVAVLTEFGWEVNKIKLDKNILNFSDGKKVVVIEVNEEYEDQLAKLYLILEKANIEGIEYESLDLRFQRPVMKLL
jgi:hypothetical protein